MESSKKDLFEGTSEHYSKYRDEYRQELIGSVVSEFKLDGRGKLLDLGC